jgi:hypothetical protein
MNHKYKGRIPPNDLTHQVSDRPIPVRAARRYPKSIRLVNGRYVLQYARTVRDDDGPIRFDPAGNCDGYFTSRRFQVHNNCYNYALNIATSTMAHPGRLHGIEYGVHARINCRQVLEGAQRDGLIYVGGREKTIADLQKYPRKNGHFVALLIAPAAANAPFRGDFHWVRCDNLKNSYWSQKDGPDQITDFDFGGELIRDPVTANWRFNNGSSDASAPGTPDYWATYKFIAYMFVPHGGAVNII